MTALTRIALACAAAALLLSGCAAGGRTAAHDPDAQEWIQLFNGRDLAGWQIKFTHRPLDENYRNTLRVEDGLLKVRYDQWPDWNGEFGHIFYNRPFSHYLIAAEYRFVGEQVRGAGPDLAWAIRNNGIMVHSQPAASMRLNQDFPISIEVQLLGGLGDDRPRTTANLCTPNTHVVMGGELITRHCTNSTSPTFHGDDWVRVEVLVLGDSLINHIVGGDTVLSYTRPQIGGAEPEYLHPGFLEEGMPLTGGFIALQAETAPIDFRKVELLNLEGCMDPSAANYRSYLVRHDPAACVYRDR
jgi:hypothetical protein